MVEPEVVEPEVVEPVAVVEPEEGVDNPVLKEEVKVLDNQPE